MRTHARTRALARALVSGACVVLAGCTEAPSAAHGDRSDDRDAPRPLETVDAAPAQGAAEAPRRNTFVYRCDDQGAGFEVVTRVGPGELAVWLPARLGGGYFVLGQVRSASGARYEGDGILVWTREREALVEVEGERFTSCAYDPARSIWEHARLSGVDFRATGNEPGWHLEIRDGERIEFTYDYGAGRVEVRAVTPRTDPVTGQVAYSAPDAADEPLEVSILPLRCNDTMSGEAFDATVVVRFGRKEFHGCGRRLG